MNWLTAIKWLSVVALLVFINFAAREGVLSRAQPLVVQLRVVGLQHIDESTVLGVVQTKVGQPFSMDLVAKDARRMLSLGLFSSLKPNIKQAADGITVEFIANENPVVREIRFDGNAIVGSSALLALLDTAIGSVLNTNTLRDDTQRINSYYNSLGYVGTPHVRDIAVLPDGTIEITVNESLLVRELRITGNTLLPTATLQRAMSLAPGVPYNEATLQQDLQSIIQRYRSAGYAAIVDGAPEDAQTGVVSIAICEVHVQAVEIKGNTKTKDYVIRRLLRVRPGDIVSDAAVQADYEALNNTQFFKAVRLSSKVVPDGCGAVVLVWNVDEKKNGHANAGLSSSGSGNAYGRGLSGNFDISESNIGGSGNGASFTLARSRNATQIDIGFTIPYVHRFTASSLAFSIFNDQAANVQYPLYKEVSNPALYSLAPTGATNDTTKYALEDAHQSGVTLSLAHPTADRTRLSYDLSAIDEGQTFSAVGIPQSALDTGLLRSQSTAYLRGVGLTLSRDDRNNMLAPRYGGTTRLTEITYSRVLGSMPGFTNVDLDATRFWPAGAQSTFALHFNAGVISNAGAVPFSSLFALSNQQLRAQKDTLYGDREILGQLELRTPLTRNGSTSIVLFADAGDVPYLTNRYWIRTDAGVGIRLRPSILPQAVRVDFATGSGTSRVTFGLGEAF